MTRSRFAGTALRRARRGVSGALSIPQAASRAHPGAAGSGAVSVLGFWPGTRRTMMDVFFCTSSASSFHSVRARVRAAPDGGAARARTDGRTEQG